MLWFWDDVGLLDRTRFRFRYTKPHAAARLHGTVALNLRHVMHPVRARSRDGNVLHPQWRHTCLWLQQGWRDYLRISVSQYYMIMYVWAAGSGCCHALFLAGLGRLQRVASATGLVGTCSDSQISQNHMQRLRSCLIMFSMFTGNAPRPQVYPSGNPLPPGT